ncbi:MAG: hypothetical protein HY953_06105 [Candidatus Rokubacteria bacterium]|nr:hypothetical protein [Candidatus Rokubacteria bacterium]
MGSPLHRPFRYEVLAGVGHFVTDQVPELDTGVGLDHLATARPTIEPGTAHT